MKNDLYLIWPFSAVLPIVYNDALSLQDNLQCLYEKVNELIDNADNVPDLVYKLLQSYISDLIVSLTYDEDKQALIVDQSLIILSEPKNITVNEEAKTVDLSAFVAGATAYQWQYSTDSGATWFDCTEKGAKTYKLTLVATTDRNNYNYRLRVNNRMRVDYTNTVTVKVEVA